MAHIHKSTSVLDWFDQRIALTKLMKVLVSEYWIPKNINFLWAMGVILTTIFVLLIVTGFLLLMYYKPDVNLAFDSVNYTIMQEVEYGWLWRHIHAVSASVIFLIMYIHLLTGLYYGSYKKGREIIWISGMVLFICFSAEAFSGYMLPWGQMSYWAATVITQLFGGGFQRIYASLGADELLGGDGYYKFVRRNSGSGRCYSRVDSRRLRRKRSDADAIFYASRLLAADRHYRGFGAAFLRA